MRPADINVPASVQKLAIVDRTKFKSGFLNVAEGILTGEMPGQDRTAVQETLNQLQNTLNFSPRFQTVKATEWLEGNGVSTVFPPYLEWSTVTQLTNKYDADGLLVLELFDTDFIITDGERQVTRIEGQGDNKREIQVTEYWAEGVGNIVLGLRLYDPQSRSIIDQQLIRDDYRWEGVGDSKQDALAALIDRNRANIQLGRIAADDYVYKISPMPITINRTIYRKHKKAPALESGTKRADVNRWQEAILSWESGLTSADEKRKGWLSYNIAVAYEILGNYDEAIRWAENAYIHHDLKKAQQLIRDIDFRLNQEDLAQRQMGNNN